MRDSVLPVDTGMFCDDDAMEPSTCVRLKGGVSSIVDHSEQYLYSPTGRVPFKEHSRTALDCPKEVHHGTHSN